MADAPVTVAANAARNGVEVSARRDGALVVPGEAVTDPVRCTLAFAAAARAAGAEVRTGFRVRTVRRGGIVISERDEIVVGDVVVDCAGPGEAEAQELLVFDAHLDRVLLGADGSVVAPTPDGRVVAAPEAVALHPPLGRLEPVATWTGECRTGAYVLRGSRTTPGLIHALASGHTGLSAALAIAEHVADLVAPGRREAPLSAIPA
jgi:glycine/D-amino acid oxidase-like deaminating enzyme